MVIFFSSIALIIQSFGKAKDETGLLEISADLSPVLVLEAFNNLSRVFTPFEKQFNTSSPGWRLIW
jgi:hypothetical protein